MDMEKRDLEQIEGLGKSLADVEKDLEHFKKGFPWMKIVAPATPERGIKVLSEKELEEAEKYCLTAQKKGVCKFVPASGAASRMFKDIFAGLATLEEGKDVPADSSVARLAANIKDFAFYTEEMFGQPQDSADYRRKVADKVLNESGLGYGMKPKGVIRFHRYADGEVRTAFAEHLVEAQDYMRNEDGTAKLVVTISPEHRPLFEAELERVKAEYEKRYGIKYEIQFSCQDKATNTIAVDPDNQPFRTDDGSLLFRPAGHGALINNLNEIEAEVVSIKNIDNVANERLLPTTAQYKKALMGEALRLRDRIFGFLNELDGCPCEQELAELLDRIEEFLDKELCVKVPAVDSLEEREALLRSKLNRPVRVCGMVKNEGEPGGGPFIVEGRDGSTSLQILESVQINKADADAAAKVVRATHFNPVDLVCCIRDYKGEKFDLLSHVDSEAGFISSKSYQGRELKALELPGLWNGAMSDWNTLFVEVPLETFNPVKVVLDLLRLAHQNA